MRNAILTLIADTAVSS